MTLYYVNIGFNFFFFFKDTATTEIYTLSLHDALPIWRTGAQSTRLGRRRPGRPAPCPRRARDSRSWRRSEEHTSELQSRQYLVCRLLLEKKIIDLVLHTLLRESSLTLDNQTFEFVPRH